MRRLIAPDCPGLPPIATTGAADLSDEAAALGLNISWAADCERNWKNCYSQIGGEAWLPGAQYLAAGASTTRKYFEDGLCSPGSLLYDPLHCDLCSERRQHVAVTMAWVFIGIEHVLVITKLLIRLSMPSKPNWVVADEAHNEFRKEKFEKEALEKLALLNSSDALNA